MVSTIESGRDGVSIASIQSPTIVKIPSESERVGVTTVPPVSESGEDVPVIQIV